jgi:hypothetical protein
VEARVSDLLLKVADAARTSGLPFHVQVAERKPRMFVYGRGLDKPFEVAVVGDRLDVRRIGVTFEPPKGAERAYARAAAKSNGSVVYLPSQSGARIQSLSPYHLAQALEDPESAAAWILRTLEGLYQALGPHGEPSAPTRPTERRPDTGVESERKTQPSSPPVQVPAVGDGDGDSDVSIWSFVPPPSEADAVQEGSAGPGGEHELRGEAPTITPRAAGDDEAAVRSARSLDYVSAVSQDIADLVMREKDLQWPFRIDLLQLVADLAPQSVVLRERHAEALLRGGRADDAVDMLRGVPTGSLSPRGAAVSLEAVLRRRRAPDLQVIEIGVDWTTGPVTDQLLEAQRWLDVGLQLRMSELFVDPTRPHVRPPRLNDWFRNLGRTAPVSMLERVMAFVREADQDLATELLLDWVTGRGLDAAQPWVREHLELYGIESPDGRVARRSCDLLTLLVRRRGDVRLASSTWKVAHARWGTEAGDLGLALVDAGLSRKHEGRELADLASILLDVASGGPGGAGGTSPEVRRLASQLTELGHSDPSLNSLLDGAATEPAPSRNIQAITTVADAVTQARSSFPDLVVLGTATESAGRRGSRQARKTWEVLQALGDIANAFHGDLDFDVDAALQGLAGYRGDVSDTAKTKYRSDYLRTLPDGREIMLGPHVPTGPEGRVYFSIDRANRAIIVGHVGSHLRGKDS